MTIIRVGCYERVSTEEQALRGYSIDTQVDNLTEYCEKNKMKIVDHYTDAGVSGGKAAFKRPEMSRLLEDVEAGKVDMILFTKLDRWFRNIQEYFKVQEILEKHRVEWKAIHEDYDTTTANGRMAITIFLAIAQNEREKTAERIKVVFEHKRKNKEACFGGPNKTLGYMKVPDEDGIARLVKDPEQEQMMTEFWEIMVKHKNMNRAIRHMNDAYGVTRNTKSWARIVRNELYCGMYKGVEDYCEPYISKADWVEIQERTRLKYSTGNTARIYLFAGMLRCPDCGNILCGSYKTETYKGVKKEYRTYRCRFINTTCTHRKYLSEKKIESFLLDNLEKLYEEEAARVELERTRPKPKPKHNLPALKERLRRLEVVYMAGNKPDDEYLAEQKEIKDLIAKAENEAPPVERDLSALKAVIETDFKTIYKSLEDEEKRRFWQSIVKEIRFDNCEFHRGKPYTLDVIFF